MDDPQGIYRAEKAKALRERRISHVQLMAEAQEAFKKMLADAAIARKGGRPRTNPAAPAPAAKAAAATKVVPVKPKAPSKPSTSPPPATADAAAPGRSAKPSGAGRVGSAGNGSKTTVAKSGSAPKQAAA